MTGSRPRARDADTTITTHSDGGAAAMYYMYCVSHANGIQLADRTNIVCSRPVPAFSFFISSADNIASLTAVSANARNVRRRVECKRGGRASDRGVCKALNLMKPKLPGILYLSARYVRLSSAVRACCRRRRQTPMERSYIGERNRVRTREPNTFARRVFQPRS